MKQGRPEPLGEGAGARGPGCSAGTCPRSSPWACSSCSSAGGAGLLGSPGAGPGAGLAPRPPACSVAARVGWTGLAVRAIRVLETQCSLIGGLPPYTWPVPPSADRPCATGLRALNFLVHANITNQAAVGTQCGQRLEDKARGSLHGNEHRVWEGKGL